MRTGLQQLRLDKQLATSERPEPAVRRHVSWSCKRRKLAAGTMCAALHSCVPPGTDFSPGATTQLPAAAAPMLSDAHLPLGQPRDDPAAQLAELRRIWRRV